MSKAHRSRRPKGYNYDWTPRPESAQIIRWVKEVIAGASYEVSVRFIFYRLVGNHGYPKTEQAYNNLAELIVKARRAGMISFRAISDSDPLEANGASGFDSRAEFLRWRSSVEGFQLDPQMEQPYYLELWSEDVGSVPMLRQIVRGLPINVYATGGFSSVTVTHAIAKRVQRRLVPTYFMHVGDLDPSGQSIFESMSQDVGAFLREDLDCTVDEETGQTYYCEDQGLDDEGPDFRPIRVALTRDQAEMWQLETAPPKASDSRSRNWVGDTVQVQAMTEDQMRAAVMETVREHFDFVKLEEIAARSDTLREEMAPLVRSAMEDVIKQLGEDADEDDE